MAFDAKRLSVIARAGDWAMWLLQCTDAAATVDTAGFITPASAYNNLMRPGHIVLRVTYTDTTYGTPSTWGFHIVITASATSVDLSDALAGTMTNTD